MPIGAMLTFLHTVTPKIDPDTQKRIGISPDPCQVFVYVCYAPVILKLTPHDPKIDPSDQKNEYTTCLTLEKYLYQVSS